MYAESGVFKPFYKQMASYEYHMTIEQTDPPLKLELENCYYNIFVLDFK